MKSFESEPLGGSDSDRVIGLDCFEQNDDIPSESNIFIISNKPTPWKSCRHFNGHEQVSWLGRSHVSANCICCTFSAQRKQAQSGHQSNSHCHPRVLRVLKVLKAVRVLNVFRVLRFLKLFRQTSHPSQTSQSYRSSLRFQKEFSKLSKLSEFRKFSDCE